MTAVWVSLGVAVALVLAWRIRRATKVLDTILTEELDQPDRAATERDEHPAEPPNRPNDLGFPTHERRG